MNDAVIVSAVRTAVGKAPGGALRGTRPDELGALVIAEALRRAPGLDGSDIDDAATENGKPYSELPNAFRYRDEIVPGCTCNGKDQFGLAPVRIEDDPTVRKGDLVAGPQGLMVAGRSADKRGASLNFSPASKSLLSRYRHVPVVARE